MLRKLLTSLCLTAIGVVPVYADAPIVRNGKPLRNRYIVTFKNDVSAAQVNGLAKALAHQHGGRLLATMTSAMRGFGVELPEPAIQGLSRNPLIALIEEDQLVELASGAEPTRNNAADPRFDFRGTMRPATPIVTSTTSCPWNAGGYYACSYTDDTFWNLDRIDNTGQLYGVKAYAYNSMGTNVRAYVVDTGVYAAHSEFDSRVVSGANMTVDPDIADTKQRSDEEEPVALDYAPETNPCFGWQTADAGVGHGTAVASVIGGNTTGVAKNVTIVPVKIMNCGGEGSMLAMARGLDWIYKDMKCYNKPADQVVDPDTDPQCSARPNRAVVNMSIIADANFGNIYCEDPYSQSPPGYSLCISSLEHEVNTLIGGNIPVVVAAGNQNNQFCVKSPSRLGYGNESAVPSTYRTITVGATAFDPTTYADQRWSCTDTPAQCPSPWNSSNDPGSNYGRCVSIWAPGWSVKVAGAGGATSYRSPGQFSTGTSFAAPLVAGAVARLLQRYSTMSATQVWTELVNRANQRVSPPDFDPLSTVFNNKLLYMSPFE